MLALLMMALIATGTYAFLDEGHPEQKHRLIALIPPTLTALASALILTHATSWPLWIGYLVATGTILGIVLALTDRAADPAADAYAGARAALNLVDDFLAFGLYIAILAAEERAFITAPLIFALTFLISLDLLAPTDASLSTITLFAATTALITSELAWVLSYWPVTPTTAAAMLTGLLYLLNGIAYQDLLGKLKRRIVLEFTLFALLFILLILYVRL